MLEILVSGVKEKKKKLASQTKISTASYQWTKNVMLTFVQILARPQSNN